MPKLVLKFEGKVIREYAFLETGMTIGRGPDNVIVIDNLAVSTHHARIERLGDDFVLTDLESTNGTFINEKKVVSYKLREGDNITIGKHSIFFVLPAPVEETEPLETAAPPTMVLDTTRYKELLAKQEANSIPASTPPPQPKTSISPTSTAPRWMTFAVLGAGIVAIIALM